MHLGFAAAAANPLPADDGFSLRFVGLQLATLHFILRQLHIFHPNDASVILRLQRVMMRACIGGGNTHVLAVGATGEGPECEWGRVMGSNGGG